jgi:hypothetical protein
MKIDDLERRLEQQNNSYTRYFESIEKSLSTHDIDSILKTYEDTVRRIDADAGFVVPAIPSTDMPSEPSDPLLIPPSRTLPSFTPYPEHYEPVSRTQYDASPAQAQYRPPAAQQYYAPPANQYYAPAKQYYAPPPQQYYAPAQQYYAPPAQQYYAPAY